MTKEVFYFFSWNIKSLSISFLFTANQKLKTENDVNSPSPTLLTNPEILSTSCKFLIYLPLKIAYDTGLIIS